jgi:hypothetical protein
MTPGVAIQSVDVVEHNEGINALHDVGLAELEA